MLSIRGCIGKSERGERPLKAVTDSSTFAETEQASDCPTQLSPSVASCGRTFFMMVSLSRFDAVTTAVSLSA